MSAASCTNTIDLNVQLPEKRLILNAFLSTEDETHIVYLAERTDRRNDEAYQGIENVYGAEVTCYVNGEPVAAAQEYVRKDEEYPVKTKDVGPYLGAFGTAYYWFNATFRPGDRIRIEAKRGDDIVYSEVVVPEPAALELTAVADTDIQITESYSEPVLKFDFRIRDVAGENTYYRVGNADRDMDLLFHFYDNLGNQTKEDVASKYTDSPKIHIGNDPILNDGYMPGSTDNVFNSLSPSNELRIFSDSQFRDKEGTVSLSVEKSIYQYRLFSLEKEAKRVDVKPTLKIKIESLSFETYNYYKALNAGESFGYDISFLMEPIIFPTNVVGGLGFVGVSSSCSLEYEMDSSSYYQVIYTN